jgi:hypothetical protein
MSTTEDTADLSAYDLADRILAGRHVTPEGVKEVAARLLALRPVAECAARFILAPLGTDRNYRAELTTAVVVARADGLFTLDELWPEGT